MTTPVGAVRARLTRAGHLPAVLADGGRVLAQLLGGRAVRLTVGPPVDDVLAAALDHGARPAAAGVAGGRSDVTPPAPPGRLGSPGGHGLPSGTSAAIAGSRVAGGSAASAAFPAPGALSLAGPHRATGAGSAPRTAGPRAGRADAPAPARGVPAPSSDWRKAEAVTMSDAGAPGAHDPAPASRPPRTGEPAPASAPIALGSSPAARGGSRLVVAPNGPGRQGPGGPGPLSGDGLGDGQRRSAPTGRRRTPRRDGEPRPSSALERDTGAFDSRPVQPTAPSADRASGGTGPVPPDAAATGPAAAGAPGPPAPVAAPQAAAPQGLAALAAWWEEHDGVERGKLPVASRLLDAGPRARRAPSRAVAGEAGEIDDGALLALDRFTAALEQVLISEAASHGIEVQR